MVQSEIERLAKNDDDQSVSVCSKTRVIRIHKKTHRWWKTTIVKCVCREIYRALRFDENISGLIIFGAFGLTWLLLTVCLCLPFSLSLIVDNSIPNRINVSVPFAILYSIKTFNYWQHLLIIIPVKCVCFFPLISHLIGNSWLEPIVNEDFFFILYFLVFVVAAAVSWHISLSRWTWCWNECLAIYRFFMQNQTEIYLSETKFYDNFDKFAFISVWFCCITMKHARSATTSWWFHDEWPHQPLFRYLNGHSFENKIYALSLCSC